MHYQTRRWTEDETATLKHLKAEGYLVKTIAHKLGRTEVSVRERWRWINKDEDQKEMRRQQVNMNRQQWRSNQAENIVSRALRASPEAIAERDHRLSLRRSLTSAFFNDPPPGYSALDRKRQGVGA